MGDVEERLPWSKLLDSETENEIERKRVEHPFAALNNAMGLQENKHYFSLLHGILIGVVIGILSTFAVQRLIL